MYDFLLKFHSGWAYIVILLSTVLLAGVLYHFFTKKKLQRIFRKVSFYTVLSFHIQFLVGLAMLITRISMGQAEGFSMSNAPLRLIFVEHPLMMFTAVILITIANAKLKKTQYVTKPIIIFLALALICFYMIPWSQWVVS